MLFFLCIYQISLYTSQEKRALIIRTDLKCLAASDLFYTIIFYILFFAVNLIMNVFTCFCCLRLGLERVSLAAVTLALLQTQIEGLNFSGCSR